MKGFTMYRGNIGTRKRVCKRIAAFLLAFLLSFSVVAGSEIQVKAMGVTAGLAVVGSAIGAEGFTLTAASGTALAVAAMLSKAYEFDVYISDAAKAEGMKKSDYIWTKVTQWIETTGDTMEVGLNKLLTGVSVARDGVFAIASDSFEYWKDLLGFMVAEEVYSSITEVPEMNYYFVNGKKLYDYKDFAELPYFSVRAYKGNDITGLYRKFELTGSLANTGVNLVFPLKVYVEEGEGYYYPEIYIYHIGSGNSDPFVNRYEYYLGETSRLREYYLDDRYSAVSYFHENNKSSYWELPSYYEEALKDDGEVVLSYLQNIFNSTNYSDISNATARNYVNSFLEYNEAPYSALIGESTAVDSFYDYADDLDDSHVITLNPSILDELDVPDVGTDVVELPLDDYVDILVGVLDGEDAIDLPTVGEIDLPTVVDLPTIGVGELDKTAAPVIPKENTGVDDPAIDEPIDVVDVPGITDVMAPVIDWGLGYISPTKGILSKFPFSIPYDLYLLVAALSGDAAADPINSDPKNLSIDNDLAPPSATYVRGSDSALKWDLTFTIPWGNNSTTIPLDIDLSDFAWIFRIIRYFTGILWLVGLLSWTRKESN